MAAARACACLSLCVCVCVCVYRPVPTGLTNVPPPPPRAPRPPPPSPSPPSPPPPPPRVYATCKPLSHALACKHTRTHTYQHTHTYREYSGYTASNLIPSHVVVQRAWRLHLRIQRSLYTQCSLLPCHAGAARLSALPCILLPCAAARVRVFLRLAVLPCRCDRAFNELYSISESTSKYRREALRLW